MLQRAHHPAYPEWAQHKVAQLPFRWQRRLVSRWTKTRQAFDAEVLGAEGDATRSAAYELQEILKSLKSVGLPLDASDSDVCERAQVMAAHCMEMGGSGGVVLRGRVSAPLFRGPENLRAAMARVCAANSIQAPAGKRMTDAGAIARMTDQQWWRRQLRKAHAKAVEGSAIAIGYVNKTRDIYVSNESVRRRMQQNRRNAEMLENTRARNEDGNEYTLAELAAKSPSNKQIKRAELMTRIAGFERIAVDMGHAGLFFTMTCPSRMHKWRTVDGGKVVENKKFDGTNPKEAQAYLSKVWSRIRAKMDRAGLAWYGFRIAEPNHDGTPHWHVLVFFEASEMDAIQVVIRHYALMDSPNERGAKEHRVDFKVMDPAKGTAAGYIAKYVAKNIDGYKVEKDLYGNDSFESSARVEAWATTWGIRQFQQVGGAPVTVWRELRRIESLPAGAPDFLVDAHSACNKVAAVEGGTASVAWDRYIRAQGGPFHSRGSRISLAMESKEGTGRYGEPLSRRPCGVVALEVQTYRDGIVPTCTRVVEWLVRSARRTWEIISRRVQEKVAAVGRTWTRVNNCTRTNFVHLRDRYENVGARPAGSGSSRDFEFSGPVNWPGIEEMIDVMQSRQVLS